MTKKQLAELLKYCSPNHLYVITWDNRLFRLECPFKVLVLENIGAFEKNEIVDVEKVKVTLELKTIYIIKGKAYYYYYFDILI